MPDDRDLALAQLAVEVGFLSRDEARHFWQQVQAPGSPRLASLLVQQGRLKQSQLDQLRAMFVARSGGAATATVTPPAGGLHTLPEGDHTASRPMSADEIWAEALARDRQLASALLQRGVVNQDRLRECHQLQLQHRMRLGPVLVRKGYADQATVEQITQQLQLGSVGFQHGGASPGTGRQPDPRAASGRGPLNLGDPRGSSGRVQRPQAYAGAPGDLSGSQRRPASGHLGAPLGNGGNGGFGPGLSPSGLGPASGLGPTSGLGPISGLAPISGLGAIGGPSPALARLENPFASVRPGLSPPGLQPNQDDVPTVTEGSPSPLLGISSPPLSAAERLAAPTAPPPGMAGGGITGGIGGPVTPGNMIPTAQDSIPTLLDRSAPGGFGLSVDELNPFAMGGAKGGVSPTAPEGPARPAEDVFGGPGFARAPALGTDSSAVTIDQDPPGLGGLATPAAGGWGAGPGLAPPTAGGEETTFPPAYPNQLGNLAPDAGAEHQPAAGAPKAPKKAAPKPPRPAPASGAGSRTLLWVVVAFLVLLVLALATLVVLRFVFHLF